MSDSFDPQVLGGSVKRGIVNPDLIEERQKCDFDQREMAYYLFGEELLNSIESTHDFIESHPEIQSGLDYYEMTRDEKFRVWWERYRVVLSQDESKHWVTECSSRPPGQRNFNWTYLFPG